MSDFLTAARSLLAPEFLLVAVPCALVIAAALWVETRDRKVKRTAAEREADRLAALDYAKSVAACDYLGWSNAARAKREASIANQREAAPWFGGGAA